MAGVYVVDCTTALHATIGILAALERRHATGQGQLVDASLLDSAVSLLSTAIPSSSRSAARPANPQLRHRGRITRVEHPSAGSVPVVGPVIGLSESPAAIRRPAPRLGEHTDEVLREWLGLPPERITALRADGVV